MDVNELRELLLKRLYAERQLFKDLMLRKEKEEIFQAHYSIKIHAELYEILAEHVHKLNGEEIRELLSLEFGILEFIYGEWLTVEDSFHEELRTYVCGELESILKKGNGIYGKEKKDGTENDKAAQCG